MSWRREDQKIGRKSNGDIISGSHPENIYIGDVFEITDGNGWAIGEHVAAIDIETLSIDSRIIGNIVSKRVDDEY